MTAIVLYGPPAAGKDTVTQALSCRDPRYAAFRSLRTGPFDPRYRPATPESLRRHRSRGELLYENERYGRSYGVDRPQLDALLAAGRVPIIHLGQVAGILAVTRHPARWIVVLLWCDRGTAAARLVARGSLDLDERLAAWDATAIDVAGAPPSLFAARIDTAHTSPDAAAEFIHTLVGRECRGCR